MKNGNLKNLFKNSYYLITILCIEDIHAGHNHKRLVESKFELNRHKRADDLDNKNILKPISEIKTNQDKSSEHHEHEHDKNENAHSAIGVTLVLGFVFMLIIDQIGGKLSHRPHGQFFFLKIKFLII